MTDPSDGVTGLELMRSIASGDAVRQFLEVYIGDITSSLAAVEQAVRAGGREAACEHLHALKNALLSGGYTSAAETCTRLNAELRAGGDGAQLAEILRRQTVDALAHLEAERTATKT